MNSLMLEPKYRDMDPQTEDLISRGAFLQNGMVVLIENPAWRTDLNRLDRGNAASKEQALDTAKVQNRWCEVSEVSCRRDILQFVAIYSDGTKRKREHSSDNAWFVKKDSLPKEEEPENTENLDADSQASEGDLKIKDGFLQYAESDREATMTLLGKQPTAVISVDLWALRDFSKKPPY